MVWKERKATRKQSAFSEGLDSSSSHLLVVVDTMAAVLWTRWRWTLLLLLMGVLAMVQAQEEQPGAGDDFLVLTVATNETDGFKRFMRSAEIYKIPVKVLGMGEAWKGGEVKKFAGGGQKINLLKRELENYKTMSNKIVMFTDSYDVVFLGTVDKILSQFTQLNARVVFSAEGFCWPDESLASEYPAVLRGKRYLNSGGFMGYAPDLYSIVSNAEVKDNDDDQLFYTKAFLNTELRKTLNIKLDNKAQIFQNLNGAVGDVELRFKGKEAYVQNTAYNTVPLILHGNGPSKVVLNNLGNYLANSWNEDDGCLSCWDNMISLEKVKEEDYPLVLLGVFIEQPTPFLEEFFHKILLMDYPKNKIDIFIHNTAEYHVKFISSFIEENKAAYRSMKEITVTDNIKEWHARNLALETCLKKDCDYFLSVDSIAHLDNPHTLKLLIEQNRAVVAPMLVRPYKAWSNFWGALTAEGFYARSTDYMEIVKNERRGLWNVPFIAGSYLVNATIIRKKESRPSFISNLLDADMAFCLNNRDKDIFMYVTNRVDWGHLINAENFDTSHVHNELYQLFDNRWDWEVRYVHENYSQSLNMNNTIQEPCPDVYWFPVFKRVWCNELIAEMENYGKWSDGSNYDTRLDGGYENVPTVDIHMKQIGMEKVFLEILRLFIEPLQSRAFTGYFHYGGYTYDPVPTVDIHMEQVGLYEHWLEILKSYVLPLLLRVYPGYDDDPPQATMNFVVRYKPEEQPALRPHHDSSTYTINVALNKFGVDYEGGGCRFVRYNCSVTDTRPGWLLMHPGRLTHYHEGLPVKTGTRYILISFVDP